MENPTQSLRYVDTGWSTRLETEKQRWEAIASLRKQFYFSSESPDLTRAFADFWNNEQSFTLLDHDPHRWFPKNFPAIYMDTEWRYMVVWIYENMGAYQYFLSIQKGVILSVSRKSEYELRIPWRHGIPVGSMTPINANAIRSTTSERVGVHV